MEIPWIEKYRPKKLDEIFHQNNAINSIKELIKNNSLPHFLFFGPPGTGKTSTILALCREIFPIEVWKDRVYEFNASDERGISFIKDTIKKIINLKIIVKENIPNIRMIILDEVDTLTHESQSALRKIMETCAPYIRFCLICNYPNKLIDPIISRCALYRFSPIPDKIILNKFDEILKNEKIKKTKKKSDFNKKIADFCHGDLRLGISLLQRYYGNNESEDIIFGEISKDEILDILNLALEQKEKELLNKFKDYYHHGISLVSQIQILLEKIALSNIDESKKSKIIQEIMEIDHQLVNGSNDYILYHHLAFTLLYYLK
jgi:DNA polymerase III delta prime subunit